MKSQLPSALTFIALAQAASAQIQGPSTGSTPYVLPLNPSVQTTSIFTVDNTGATPDDVTPGGYGMAGIPDGLGAYDNGNGTFTVLMNHELGNTAGIVRAHGKIGAFVSEYVINKNTFAVTSGADLMQSIYGWDSVNQVSNATPTPGGVAFNRFCSADLPVTSAFFNIGTGLGTTDRIFMHGEEGGATGYQQGTVATGPERAGVTPSVSSISPPMAPVPSVWVLGKTRLPIPLLKIRPSSPAATTVERAS